MYQNQNFMDNSIGLTKPKLWSYVTFSAKKTNKKSIWTNIYMYFDLY